MRGIAWANGTANSRDMITRATATLVMMMNSTKLGGPLLMTAWRTLTLVRCAAACGSAR